MYECQSSIFQMIPVVIKVALILVVLLLPLFALTGLRGRRMDEVAKFLWVLLIIFVPLIGAVTCLIVAPGRTYFEEAE